LTGVQAVPAAHALHEPPVQICPCPHALPQLPQFAASVWRFTHAASQAVSGAAQPVPEHVPAAHVCPWPQAVPHPPQFASSVCTFTQTPPHGVVPAPQVTSLPPLLPLLHPAASAASPATSSARTMRACVDDVLMVGPRAPNGRSSAWMSTG